MKRHAIAAALPGLLLISPLGWSGQSLEEMLITATRTQQSIDATLAPVTVITRTDIERLQPTDLPDLLTRIPGADIKHNGGEGSVASLFLRGTNSEHTLVLIDGQRIGSASNGSSPLQFIDPEQIERIEIVRGPRSSLYGADSIGGVIQIFTRDTGSYLKAGYGSHNAYRVSGAHYDQQGAWHYGASASYYQTDGIDNTTNRVPPANDDDAYRNASVSARLGYDISSKHKLDLRYNKVQTENEYDGFGTSQPYSDSWLQSIDLSAHNQWTPWWFSTLRFGHSINDSDARDDIDLAAHDHYRTTRWSGSWQNDFTLAKGHIATLGFDYYNDKLDSSQNYQTANGQDVESRDNKAVFIQYQGTVGLVDWVVGGRHDDNEYYGEKTTGTASIGVNLPKNHRVILSYGTGFRAPTFNDLYWPGAGNPNLEPEDSENTELELRGDYQYWRWNLNVYHNNINNLIAWAPQPSGLWQPSNVNSATIDGVDFSLEANLENWLFALAASYVEARDDETDNILRDRARTSVNVDIDRRFGDFTVGMNWRVQNGRYVYGNERRLPGYGTLGLRFAYQATPNLKLQLKVNNALDKEYLLSDTYQQDGSNAFATVTWSL